MCPTGKITYPSPQAAWHAAAILRRKRIPRTRTMRGHTTTAIHAYRCHHCHGWHITSSRHDDPQARTS